MVEYGRHRRWDPCIAHQQDEVDRFFACYLTKTERKVLLVAGAGFDPRARAVAYRLRVSPNEVHALFIKENRPNPPSEQSDRAEENTKALMSALPNQQLVPVDIFGSDGAVVGGRNIVNILVEQDVQEYTDIVVDISALSVGTSFPIIRYYFESIVVGSVQANLHLFVAHDPGLDTEIRSIPSDEAGYVHGFRGGASLFDNSSAARLWLPQLASGRRNALEKLYDFVGPDDTCPILPFPASDPLIGDRLAGEYLNELENSWQVDTRNIVYADEGDPLDLYRTVLRLDDMRRPIFEGSGGSMVILSPLGSKVMALGALMAALERDLPVAHVEPIGYRVASSVPSIIDQPNLIHVWLEGDVYPRPRPVWSREGSGTA